MKIFSSLAVLFMFSLDVGAKDYGCLENAYRSCLQNGRFKVEAVVSYTDAGDGKHKNKSALIKDAIIGDAASLFYFFNFDNPELLVKVADACGLNGKFWVFGSAATDLDYSVTINDLKTGARKIYRRNSSNPLVNDTKAFGCN